MPKWTYDLTIYNALDRTLHLAHENIAWGSKGSFPSDIEAGKSGVYQMYSSAGKPAGIEFYLTFNDVAPTSGQMYGTMNIKVDMPYWKHKNSSSCEVTGLLKATGFKEIPDGNHDFSTSVTVSRSV